MSNGAPTSHPCLAWGKVSTSSCPVLSHSQGLSICSTTIIDFLKKMVLSFFLLQMRTSATNTAEVNQVEQILLQVSKSDSKRPYNCSGQLPSKNTALLGVGGLFGMELNFKQAPGGKKRVFRFSFKGTNLSGFGTQMNPQVFWAKVGCELVTFSGGKGNVKEKNPGNAHVKWTSQVQTMEKLKNWYGGKHFVVVAISHCSSL